jgi:hypothetical protein
MKTTFLKISAFILLFTLMGAGCKKDDEIFELQIGDKNAVIQKEVDGIEFKFCLLNEQREPATIFNEGENFTFHFSIKNNTMQDLFFDRNVILNSEFCKVYSNENNKTIGTPFEGKYIYLIGPGAFKLSPGETDSFEVPWVDIRDEWSHSFISFNSTHQKPLSSGSYYTGFTHQFNFENVKTKALTFKITFEIK